MSKFSPEAKKVMIERFGMNSIIALSTTENDVLYVRYVNAYYEDCSFYVITYVFSNKTPHIKSGNQKLLSVLPSKNSLKTYLSLMLRH